MSSLSLRCLTVSTLEASIFLTLTVMLQNVQIYRYSTDTHTQQHRLKVSAGELSYSASASC